MSLRKAPKRDSDSLPSYGPNELMLKILVIGDYGVGKTAIVRRYTEGKFSSTYKVTIGADFALKTLEWDTDRRVNLQLWDIAGHERFGYMTRVYYKHADAAVLVFDVSRAASFQSVKKWLSDLRSKVILPNTSDIPVVLLANKFDINQPAVSNDQIIKFCKDNNILSWFVSSAKDNLNIDLAMTQLVKNAIKNSYNKDVKDSIKLSDAKTAQRREKKTCC